MDRIDEFRMENRMVMVKEVFNRINPLEEGWGEDDWGSDIDDDDLIDSAHGCIGCEYYDEVDDRCMEDD